MELLMKKMPEYNVEYSIQLAYNVNDVAIKSYDIKKDDVLVIDKYLYDQDNQEPMGPGKDPFKIDKVSVIQREKMMNPDPVLSFDRNSNSSAISISKKGVSPTSKSSKLNV